MERRQFMKGVLGAAVAVPATFVATSKATAGDSSAEAVAAGLQSDDPLARQEIALVGWMRSPPVRQLIAGYDWNTTDADRRHLNKLTLLALGQSESREALAHLLEVRAYERSETLRRIASIQVYRFQRRIAMAPIWASMIR